MATNQKLHVGYPNQGNRRIFLEQINDVLDRNWLTNDGPLLQKFEKHLEEYLGVRNCVCVCNGTIGLELAIRGLNLKGEVILPSFTFIATAHALQWQGIKPVFCDINPNTYCIDPKKIEPLITEETSGIIGVHIYGRGCEVESLEELSQQYNLKLFFDAAHAFGCTLNNKKIASFGACEVFSFHATKVFNSIEGGAITTNDDELAERLRLMRNFGFSGFEEVSYLGTNGKMNEFSAAMGLTNLNSLDAFININKNNYLKYKTTIGKIRGLSLIEYDENEHNNYHYIVVEVNKNYPLTRDQLMLKLHKNNIIARRYFSPGCHKMEPYRTLLSSEKYDLKLTEEVSSKILVLPTGALDGQEGDVVDMVTSYL